MLLCVVKVLSGVAGRPVMGHSGEGELLLGHALSGRVGWDGGRRIDRRTTGDGVRQLLGQAAIPDLVRRAGAACRSRERRSA
jgi:hypothetical protein